MMFEDRLVLDKLLKAYDKAYYEGRPEQAVLLKEQIEKLLGTLPTLPKKNITYIKYNIYKLTTYFTSHLS